MKKVYEIMELVYSGAEDGSYTLDAIYISGSDTFGEAEKKLLEYGGMPHKRYIILPVYRSL